MMCCFLCHREPPGDGSYDTDTAVLSDSVSLRDSGRDTANTCSSRYSTGAFCLGVNKGFPSKGEINITLRTPRYNTVRFTSVELLLVKYHCLL